MSYLGLQQSTNNSCLVCGTVKNGISTYLFENENLLGEAVIATCIRYVRFIQNELNKVSVENMWF